MPPSFLTRAARAESSEDIQPNGRNIELIYIYIVLYIIYIVYCVYIYIYMITIYIIMCTYIYMYIYIYDH